MTRRSPVQARYDLHTDIFSLCYDVIDVMELMELMEWNEYEVDVTRVML